MRYFLKMIKTFLNKARYVAIVTAFLAGIFVSPNAQACFGPDCFACSGPADTAIAASLMDILEDGLWEPAIEENIIEHLNFEQNFIVEDFFQDFWVRALAELTEYLGAFGMYQVQMVGTFFDAKNQLETRRLYFELQAEAHKDYHPSESFCQFGTNVRSLAGTESRAKVNMSALSIRSIRRQLASDSTASSEGLSQEKTGRWNQFVTTYCDEQDNGWSRANTGLDLACDHDGAPGGSVGATDRARVNRDIDYTQVIDLPRTLSVNFTAPGNATADTQDVIALSSNLYAHNVPTRRFSRDQLKQDGARKLFLDMRSVVAKRNVAQNSFNAIVAFKSSGSSSDTDGQTTLFPPAPNTSGTTRNLENHQTNRFMGAILRDIMPSTLTDAEAQSEVDSLLGADPSYYAQLEVLSKKIYQNPNFFANLYDKPANVERKSVAMKGIELMLDRALFESELRQEMLMSVMLSNEVGTRFGKISRDLTRD